MAAKYWIKLYHEILRDRKMVTMDDHLWRRTMECFLMAGKNDKGGYLPSLVDMAFELRTTEEVLETDLNELIRIGILESRDGYYFVAKFAERQAAMPKAEFNRRRREEERLLEYNQPDYRPVTNGNTDKIRIDTDIDIDTDKDTEEIREDIPFSALLHAFVESTHIPETMANRTWVDSINKMVTAGITPGDVIEAVSILQEKEYSIVSPKSIINTALSVMSARLKPPPKKQTNHDKSLEAIARFGGES